MVRLRDLVTEVEDNVFEKASIRKMFLDSFFKEMKKAKNAADKIAAMSIISSNMFSSSWGTGGRMRGGMYKLWKDAEKGDVQAIGDKLPGFIREFMKEAKKALAPDEFAKVKSVMMKS